ncbi:DUF4185 domain-containing protein [bacterium]|nr:DUF4185 domain-containing protein [bacterium]
MKSMVQHLVWLCLLLGWSVAGADPLAPQIESVEAWPQADLLFRRDPRWLGGDGAYSLDLGGGRVLWLFGDSFVVPRAGVGRAQAAIVRNSVAIQQGYDPSTASLTFGWGAKGGEPASFFPDREDGVFYWPGHAILLDRTLLVFLMKVRSAKNELGFETCGWDAMAISNPADPPEQWRMRLMECEQNDFGVLVGSATIMRQGEDLYALSAQEPGHSIYAVRWPVAQALAGNLTDPSWWSVVQDQPGKWVPQSQLSAKPSPLFTGGAVELTVHRDPRLQRWISIQTEGFGAADLAMRSAAELTGPWTPLQKIYHPPESNDKRLMIYAGKCHPEQLGADWVLTYVANSFSFEHLLATPEIYYPHFLRVRLKRP